MPHGLPRLHRLSSVEFKESTSRIVDGVVVRGQPRCADKRTFDFLEWLGVITVPLVWGWMWRLTAL